MATAKPMPPQVAELFDSRFNLWLEENIRTQVNEAIADILEIDETIVEINAEKANRATTGDSGNILFLTANGDYEDSGYTSTDFRAALDSKFGDVAGGNYSEFESDGTLKMIGAATVFDDLQVGISNVKMPPANSPTWRYYDHGIAAGVTFPVLGFALNHHFYFAVQSSHSMKLSSVLDNHFHYTTPTDGTGDKFKFQLDVIAAPIGGSWAVASGSPFTVEVSMDADLSNQHRMQDIADIPGINTTVSTLYKCEFTRIAASADEYAGEVYIEFSDCHYEANTLGSRTEGVK
ncbi:MAG: hypothetical protein JJV98_20660 [Desulfosarcina sp.]|nr:hypothetical protein [Desulfobacterales bacterium]